VAVIWQRVEMVWLRCDRCRRVTTPGFAERSHLTPAEVRCLAWAREAGWGVDVRSTQGSDIVIYGALCPQCHLEVKAGGKAHAPAPDSTEPME